jgi:opacity protein-like surface antigen
LAFAAFVAMAAPAVMAADTGWYAGVSLAASRASIERSDFGPLHFNARFAEDRSGRQLSVFGGYRSDSMWSFEGGYVDGGRYRETATATSGVRFMDTVYAFDYKARSLFLAGKASFSLADGLSAFARLGVAANRATMRASVDASRHIEPPLLPCPPSEPSCLAPFSNSSLFTGSDRRSDTRMAALLGIGLEYKVAQTGALRLTFDDFGRFGDASKTGRFKLRGLGLAYAQAL